MATVNVVLRPSKADARGRAPLYLRISDGERHRFQSLKMKVRPADWNADKQEGRKGHREHEEMNERIAERVREAREEARRRKWTGADRSADALARALRGEDEGEAPGADFFAYADAWADGLRREGRIYYWKRVRSALKKFRLYAREPLPFDRLTPDLLKGHQAHMIGELGNTVNTAKVSFTILRTVVRNAVREGVLEPAGDPFLRFAPAKETRTERAKLTAEEIAAIEGLELERGGDLDLARDLFLFALYAAGVRYGDVARLRWRSIRRHGGGFRLTYTMGKTGTAKDVKLNAKAAAIVERYRPEEPPAPDDLVFPLLQGYDLSTPEGAVKAASSRNVVVNRALKEIAKRAEVNAHLSFHVARHSFADLARRNGADVYKVSKALGHANLKVTARYLAGFDDKAADDAIDTAFG